mmetsp:Transcript_54520/g.100887  ORF Transcript_54520/g.100887 Transcript_54520/m.100887 type:complete len:295 (+) Transcript_54520:92-976(+)
MAFVDVGQVRRQPVTLQTQTLRMTDVARPVQMANFVGKASDQACVAPLSVGALMGAAAAGKIGRKRKVPVTRRPVDAGASEYAGDASKISTPAVVKHLSAAETSLQFWGYIGETAYSWLGLISLGVACFSAYSRGPTGRNASSFMGLATVGLSVMCGFVGWFQSRMCRQEGRRCGLASASLEPSSAPTAQLTAMIPQLGGIESLLSARQRTAWLGMLFSVVGLQAMVGLLVAKVLSAGGGLSIATGFQLDVFTLLAVSNTALSHVIAVGVVALQRAALPAARAGGSDMYRGWDR